MTSAVFNFLGVLSFPHHHTTSTISNMVDFGGNTHEALIALCAALFSIVVYSVGAAPFGIPTSESHSLIAGLTGAAIAIQNGIGGINMGEWVKVLYGLVLSLALGFLAGWGICRLVILVCAGMDRRKTNGFFQGAQIFAAAAMSFMHGAQDGQKFIGVLFLGMAFCGGQESVTGMVIPAWLMLMCSTVMGLGTSVGGERSSSRWEWIWCAWRSTRGSPQTWRRRPACCSPACSVSQCPPPTPRPAPSWVWGR